MSVQNQRMLKKAIIIGPAYPLRGGIANLNESLCTEMNKAGIDTSIVSFSLQYPSILFPGTSQKEKSPASETVGKLKIEPLINSVNPLSWYSTARHIAARNPDLVIVRYWLPFFAPALGIILRGVKRKLPHVKIIAITDNILPHEKRIGDKALTNYFLKACDAFVVMSATVRDELLGFVQNAKVKLIHHPVYDIFGSLVSKEEARRRLNLNPLGRYILFFGFVRKYKGLDLLLEALADKRLKEMNIHLLIAGEFYESRQKYIDIISANRLDDRVVLFDYFIPSHDVRYYFAGADLVTQPYRSASQSGITQLAYHFERPVLVTNVGGLAEVIESDRSGYVTSTDPEDIAGKIADFYLNNREEEMVSEIKQQKHKFSWSAMVDGIRTLFDTLSG